MMLNHAPLTAHERIKAQTLLRRLDEAKHEILPLSIGPDAVVPRWVADAAYDRFWDASRELRDWLHQDNAVGVRSCLENAPRLPPRRS